MVAVVPRLVASMFRRKPLDSYNAIPILTPRELLSCTCFVANPSHVANKFRCKLLAPRELLSHACFAANYVTLDGWTSAWLDSYLAGLLPG